MKKKQNKQYIVYSLLSLFSLNIEASEEGQGCSIASRLKEQTPSFRIREEPKKREENSTKKVALKITETLTSVETIHQNQKLIIKRTSSNKQHTCPPFCIQPINIQGVTTVGELEVLDFIKQLKGKEGRLLIDIRNSKVYKKNTIPGAINIPYTMLEDTSKYQNRVLQLLGGEKIDKLWKFKYVPILLIFGESEESSYPLQAIKTLIKLAYPNNKIYFYRAGVKGWSRLGLTLY